MLHRPIEFTAKSGLSRVRMDSQKASIPGSVFSVIRAKSERRDYSKTAGFGTKVLISPIFREPLEELADQV